MDLRRPRNFSGNRYGYIHEGHSTNTLWQTKKDTEKKEVIEIIRNPSYNNIDSILNTSSSNNQNTLMMNQSLYFNRSSYFNSEYLNKTLESNNIAIKEYEDVNKIYVSIL